MKLKDKKRLEVAIIFLLFIIAGILIASRWMEKGDSEGRKYVAKSVDECSRVQFLCAPGYSPFVDSTGCGCEKTGDDSGGDNKNFCPLYRNESFCTEIYDPVCGWSDPDKIQCIRFPCAQTYANGCYACQDGNVEYWTKGMCES